MTDKQRVAFLRSFCRKIKNYFGITLIPGDNFFEVDLMEYNLDTREIYYTAHYSSDAAPIALLFHEIGHFIFDPSSVTLSTIYAHEKRCWEVGFAIMSGVFGIEKTKDMEKVMKKCLKTYRMVNHATTKNR